MKDIRPGLFAFLAADASIAAVVTEGGISRIYPIMLPQGVRQASIVYTKISGEGDYTLRGPTGYAQPRFQIDAWAPGPSPDAAVALANRVKDALDGFTGAIGTGENAVFVQGIFVAGEREDYDDATEMFRVSRDYIIHHDER